MERVEGEEMLDSDDWSEEEIACALRAIRRVNLLYGGDRMHKRLFRRVAARMPGKTMDILEVASARGEVAQAVARMLRKDGFAVRLSLLDRSSLHLPQTSDMQPNLPAPTLLAGDALDIPLEDGSVDVVSCCLFLHHLGPRDAHAFLKEALRVARVAVVVNDVERTRTNYILSKLQRLIDPSRLSRHDGPTSVRQAYTFGELEQMARETGCSLEIERGLVYRLGLIVWKR